MTERERLDSCIYKLNTKDCQQPAETRRKQEKTLPWGLQKKHGPAKTLISYF